MRNLVFAWVLLACNLVWAQTTRSVYRSAREIILSIPADIRPDLDGKTEDTPLVMADRRDWAEKNLTGGRVRFSGKIERIEPPSGEYVLMSISQTRDGSGKIPLYMRANMRLTRTEARKNFLRSNTDDPIRCTVVINAIRFEVNRGLITVLIDGDFESRR